MCKVTEKVLILHKVQWVQNENISVSWQNMSFISFIDWLIDFPYFGKIKFLQKI